MLLDRKGGKAVDVANLLPLLQDLGFSNKYIVIFTVVTFVLATIYSVSLIKGQWLINKGLELDNEKKGMDNELLRKQITQPDKKASKQDAGTTCTKANLKTENRE